MLNVGVIGAGRIGQLHVKNLKKIPRINIKAIADVQQEAIMQWAKSEDIEFVTKDPMDIINDPIIDAVIICSPTNTHAQLIIESAKAKKHIFCEKPVSFSTEETKKALEFVKKHGVILQVGFNRRFDESFRTLHSLIQQGELGKVHTLRITSRDPYPPPTSYIESSGGLFMDMMIHDFDMARYILQSEVVEVYAKGATLIDEEIAKYGDIDTAIVTLTFDNGALGTIENSRKSAFGYDQRLEVFGENGAFTVDNNRPNNIMRMTADGIGLEKPFNFFLERYDQAYINEIHEFCRAITLNSPVKCSGEDGYAAEVIAEACKLSLISGKAVSLKGGAYNVLQ